MDLHIGITDSRGNVYEFDRKGMSVTSCGSNDLWNQCLVIPITTENTVLQNYWLTHWDYTLSITASMDIWTREAYHEQKINCYSFVLTFLKMLNVKQLKPSLSSKEQFCTDFILPRTRLAAKYISLYRQVIREAVSVIPLKTQASPVPSSSSSCVA